MYHHVCLHPIYVNLYPCKGFPFDAQLGTCLEYLESYLQGITTELSSTDAICKRGHAWGPHTFQVWGYSIMRPSPQGRNHRHPHGPNAYTCTHLHALYHDLHLSHWLIYMHVHYNRRYIMRPLRVREGVPPHLVFIAFFRIHYVAYPPVP